MPRHDLRPQRGGLRHIQIELPRQHRHKILRALHQPLARGIARNVAEHAPAQNGKPARQMPLHHKVLRERGFGRHLQPRAFLGQQRFIGGGRKPHIIGECAAAPMLRQPPPIAIRTRQRIGKPMALKRAFARRKRPNRAGAKPHIGKHRPFRQIDPQHQMIAFLHNAKRRTHHRAGKPGHPYTGQNTWNGVDYGPAPNNGAGFTKDLSGNELPNAPHFTTSFTAEYSVPVTDDWAATLHGDFYWQANSWARVFNDNPYDRLHGYTNVNFALILTNQNGWQATAYVKNAFDTTAITGDFLNSDDTGLTTNVFLTDPRLFGIRVTKNW